MVADLANIGIFLAGIGVFFVGCAFFWFCSLYAKK
jgi:hypothetical protein